MDAPYEPPKIKAPVVKPYLPDPVLVALWEVAEQAVPTNMLPITEISAAKPSADPQSKTKKTHHLLGMKGAA